MGDRYLVTAEEKSDETVGGILISGGADKVNSNVIVGRVEAVGDEVTEKGIEIGSRVMFAKYGATEVSRGLKCRSIFHPSTALGFDWFGLEWITYREACRRPHWKIQTCFS